jgi:hypothetical protein
VSEREGFDFGVPCWIDTWQDDPEAAARFYAGLFGWEIEETTPAGSERQIRVLAPFRDAVCCAIAGGSASRNISVPARPPRLAPNGAEPAQDTPLTRHALEHQFVSNGHRLHVVEDIEGPARLDRT